MLLCRYFNPKLGYETEEHIKDNDYYCFAQRKPDESRAEHCYKVVASDAWLERIRKHFSGLPFFETGVYLPTIAWYGDDAKFIAGNISDVCSVYFQFWMNDKEEVTPERATLGEALSLHYAFAGKKLDRIRELVDDHSINDLERTVKIQEVLEW